MLNSTTTYFRFFSGKQLSRAATKSTRQIVRVRIHGERAIERLKGFKVFQGNLPLTLAKLADQMLIVCGGLRHFLSPREDKYHCTLYSHCFSLSHSCAGDYERRAQ